MSLRGAFKPSRVIPSSGIARNTVGRWRKKPALPALEDTLVLPDRAQEVALERDELWWLVGDKKNKRWVWLALCKQTRQVVACAVGSRGEATCERLWQAVPTRVAGSRNSSRLRCW
jgi:hypothetical protein